MTEKDMLEKKREIFIKRIDESISHHKYCINDIEIEMEEKWIDQLDDNISKLTEHKKEIDKLIDYKKEIENAKNLPEMLKIWLNILEDRESGLSESSLYRVLCEIQERYKQKIELDPEENRHLIPILDKCIKGKNMLIEGMCFPRVGIELLRKDKKGSEK